MKKCSKCKEIKPTHQFAPRGNTRHNTCQDCRKPTRTRCKVIYPTSQLDKLSLIMSRKITKSAYHNRLGKVQIERSRIYSKRHYDKIAGERLKSNTITLHDNHIKKLLVNVGIVRNIITPELINAKRNQLILKRCLKQINN